MICFQQQIHRLAMARPSIKNQRFEQILDAFELCVVRYGLAGATLEQVAEQAQLARPLIRHHIGNREDLVKALINRFNKRSDFYMQQLILSLPEENRFSNFIERLFDEIYFDPNLVLLTEALIAAAADKPDLAVQLRKTIESIIVVFIKELRLAYPKSTAKSARVVATGIMGIYFNADSLSMLGNVKQLRRDSKLAATRLADTLDA